jgi:TPP-dependent indolepyruvate ferredoxin oxidoreductase alpha subunit
MRKVIEQELEYRGTSVVICVRECIQTMRRKAK